jgi:tryptophan halogenase
LHNDAREVALYLRRYAEARGVVRHEGQVTRVMQGDNGFIESVALADGRQFAGDFFIDCTGFKALLIEKQLGTAFEDWSHYLPCDRAIAVKTEGLSPILPYTLATARKAGWTWRIPLQQRVGHGYVYASRFCSDADAKSTLLQSLDGKVAEDPRLIPFVTGRRREIWKHNCLSLGLAAGFIEPLESTSIHLIARGMEFFLRYFPDRDCDPALLREYNRRMSADYEEVRDFIVLHYAATSREDTPFWRWCRQIVLPDSLRERIELFRAHGGLREGVDELFRNTSWQSVFEGMGIRPEKHHPRVDHMDPEHIRVSLHRAKQAIHGMVKTLPTHDEFLRSLGQDR